MLEFERDPLFKIDDMYDLNKEQLRERTMEKVMIIILYHLPLFTENRIVS